LLDLGEAVGTQSRGLSQEHISLLPVTKYKCGFFSRKKTRRERSVYNLLFHAPVFMLKKIWCSCQKKNKIMLQQYIFDITLKYLRTAVDQIMHLFATTLYASWMDGELTRMTFLWLTGVWFARWSTGEEICRWHFPASMYTTPAAWQDGLA
jgi:hypothetical protein